ncbi:MAG TPA: peroxiredoxin [Terriglobales bacterium]|nr:peroxiredoxin [Terriglobales bacterium]
MLLDRPAPAFRTEDQDGAPVQLADFRGRPVVLFFYPRASTSGCTIEVQQFRDAYPRFQRAGVVVLGMSPDTVKAQKKFHDTEGLPYPLLADPERTVCERYGLVKEKNMYGRKVLGVARTTLLISPDGKIARVLDKVKPEGHADQVWQELQALGWVKK